MTEYGLSIRAQYSAMSDTELDTLVNEIQVEFPTCGNRQMQGHLISKGHHIQQYRVRESQQRIDPNGTIMRRLHAVTRRQYSVPFPRSLYRIDEIDQVCTFVINHISLIVNAWTIIVSVGIFL